jgi:hypothetical protein
MKPSKKVILIVLTVWIVSIIMVLAGATDGFKIAVPFNIILLLVIPSLVVVLTLLINYNKQKK